MKNITLKILFKEYKLLKIIIQKYKKKLKKYQVV